jgi:hypothetical protein
MGSPHHLLELFLFVLCVGQLGCILCEYSAQPIGNSEEMYCSHGPVASPLGYLQR